MVTVALLTVIAVGVYLPVPEARAALCPAMLAAVGMWAAGQDLGGLFTRATTDPDTAPLLILLAGYWPTPPTAASARSPAGNWEQAHSSPEPRPLAGAYMLILML